MRQGEMYSLKASWRIIIQDDLQLGGKLPAGSIITLLSNEQVHPIYYSLGFCVFVDYTNLRDTTCSIGWMNRFNSFNEEFETAVIFIPSQ